MTPTDWAEKEAKVWARIILGRVGGSAEDEIAEDIESLILLAYSRGIEDTTQTIRRLGKQNV